MILAHQYGEAASCYEAQLRDSPDDPGILSAHARAMLGLGRLDVALKEYTRANLLASEVLKGETQPYLNEIGLIHWLMGNQAEAIETFRFAVKGIENHSIKFADQAGGVTQGMLLWYAGLTAGDKAATNDALKYLEKLGKKPRAKYWPGVLALFAIGMRSEEEVLLDFGGTDKLDELSVRAKSEFLIHRCLVQSLFYFATRKRQEGSEKECRTLMSQCANLENPVLEPEWYLARFESEQMLGPRSS